MKYFGYILFAVLVLALQIFFVNRMWSGLYISLYPAIFLLIDLKTPRWLLLLLAFIIGAVVDVASAGCGLNSAVSVFIAYIRNPLAELTLSSVIKENGGPVTTYDVNLNFFLRYLCTALAIWSILFFTLESGFSSMHILLMRIVVNIILSSAVISILQLMIRH